MDNWDAVLMVQHIKALAIAMMAAAAEGLMRPFCRVHGYHGYLKDLRSWSRTIWCR